MEFKICDGTIVKFEPIYQDIECGECGHITGKEVSNEPDFHSEIEKIDKRYFCKRCKEEMGNLYSINALFMEGMTSHITRMLEETNVFYKRFNK